jgi:uncharacterized protein
MEASGLPPREADLAPDDPTAESGAGTVLADPAALGLTAFATTTFILSMINTGLVGGGLATQGVNLGVILAYGGVAQFVAGVWELRNGNTFGATAFCSFGAFWVSFYILLHIGAATIPKTEVASAVGLYLWAWAIFTAYMFIASLRTTGAIAGVLLTLTATFILLAIGNSALSGSTATTNSAIKIGGYTGLASAIIAWYTSFAIVANTTFKRTILPVFPLSK